MVDESRAAIESARISFSHNYPQADIQLLHNDGLHEVSQAFDLIVINPPFHQQNTVTTDIAMSMFAQAKACLTSNGELWIVANRHLNYQSSLKRWFRKVNVVTQNDKFIIIQAKQ
jgi:16S rRNA G1207 methylase RsmC